jgi:hypothetical protein
VSAGSTILTVPIEFIREMGIPEWVERTGSTDYTVWVTWLDDRNAVSYYFPEPDTPEQLDAATPRQLLIRTPREDTRCYQLTIPANILDNRGITDEILDDGYTVFPEPAVDNRLLTIELPRPDDRTDPWSDLDEGTPESPAADWLLDGTHPDGTEPEPTPAKPTQRRG